MPVVTSERLGRSRVSGQPFVNPDGSPLRIDTDFFGKPRDPHKPAAGPFEDPGGGKVRLAAADGRLVVMLPGPAPAASDRVDALQSNQ